VIAVSTVLFVGISSWTSKSIIIFVSKFGHSGCFSLDGVDDLHVFVWIFSFYFLGQDLDFTRIV